MDGVLAQLSKIISSSFGIPVEEVRPDVTFAELEFDSLALVELALDAQREFGVPIGEDELNSNNTVADAVNLISTKVAATP